MSPFKTLQMLITVVLLIMAAATLMFKTNIQVPQTLSLRMDRPAGAPEQFSVLTNLSVPGEYRKHAKAMDSFRVTNMTYTIKDFEGSQDAVISGEVAFAPSGSTSFQTLATFEDLNLYDLAANKAEVLLPVTDTTATEKLADLLQSGSTVTFRLNAGTNNNPLAATLALNIATEMTVAL
ncbi:hypothetical protein [Pontibacter liquoris]|uniref:hypothetical protein n=1 Tax=Pontibacter liquoris TaxID=2905677 RepID=UPI001FA77220|nr:hypothetical protein [Pontibacter liquoris]